jgi:hypothetical protein
VSLDEYEKLKVQKEFALKQQMESQLKIEMLEQELARMKADMK